MHRRGSKTMPPDELCALGLSTEAILAITGVDRSTLTRWRTGQSRIPHAASQLLRFRAVGTIPDGFGGWSGWQLTGDEIIAPGWSQGARREDVAALFWYRQAATLAEQLTRRVAALEKELGFFREETRGRSRLGFAIGMAEVLQED